MPATVRAESATWVPSLPIDPYQDSTELSALSDGTGFTWDPGAGLLYVTHNEGENWSLLPQPPAAFVRMATDTVGYSAASDGRVWRTSDGAQTWTQVASLPIPISQFADGLGVADAGQTVVVIADRGIYTSHDAGSTWKLWQGLQRDESISPFRPVFMGPKGTFAAIAYAFANGDGTSTGTAVYVTHDGGGSFKRIVNADPSTNFLSVAMSTNNLMLIGRANGVVLRSTNGGASFTVEPPITTTSSTQATLGVNPAGIWSMSLADAKVGYILTNGGGIWRSSDGGQTWHEESSPVATVSGSGLGEIALFDEGHGIAGGPTAVSYRSLNASLPVPEVSPPTSLEGSTS